MQPLFYRRICGRLQKAVIRFPRNKSEGDTRYPESRICRKYLHASFYDFCPLKLRQWLSDVRLTQNVSDGFRVCLTRSAEQNRARGLCLRPRSIGGVSLCIHGRH